MNKSTLILKLKIIVWSIQYATITLKHKWFLMIAGRKLGVDWGRIIKHDLSKFSLSELPEYGRKFYGDGGGNFSEAWKHHIKYNKHHWEWWHCGGDYCILMSRESAREMVADWMAASRAYEKRWPTKDNWPWFEKNFILIKLNSNTRLFVRRLIDENL